MRSTPKTIADQYAAKRTSYNAKYRVGNHAHIHTGLFATGDVPRGADSADAYAHVPVDRLRWLLQVGQHRLSCTVIDSLISLGVKTGDRVLDCGAGHGGTTLLMAEAYGLRVTALTVAPAQRDEITANVTSSPARSSVSVMTGDVLAPAVALPQVRGCIGIDAFCQVGTPQHLYPRLHEALGQGGVCVVSDYFAVDEQCAFKTRFDTYWQSDLTHIRQTLDAATEAGFRIVNVLQQTNEQLPFWDISAAYSTKLLAAAEAQESQRLQDSLAFHRDMATAFRSGKLSYYHLALKREAGA